MSQEVEKLKAEIDFLERRVEELEGELEASNKPRIKQAWQVR